MKIIERLVCLFFLSIVTVFGGDEADVPVLTVEDCVHIGLARSVPVANARRDEEIAAARIRQVRAQALPEIKARGDYTRLDRLEAFDLSEGRMELGQLDNYSASAEAGQLLYSGGSLRAALRAADFFREGSWFNTQRVEQQMTRDIRVAFYGLLLADLNVEVERASFDQLRALAEQAEAKYRNSTASEFEMLSARVRVANQAPVLISAKHDLEIARAAFRDLLNLEEDDFVLRGDLSFAPVELDYELWLQKGLNLRPELLRQKSMIGLWQEDISVVRGGYLPRIRARAAYGGVNPASYFSEYSEWGWRWDAGVTMEWDVLDGGLRRARMLEKTLELAKARDTQIDLTRMVELEIRKAYLDLKHASEAVAATTDNVRLAERSMDIAKARYDSGLTTYLEYADANLALSSARLLRYGALRAHLVAIAQLCWACGLDVLEVF